MLRNSVICFPLHFFYVCECSIHYCSLSKCDPLFILFSFSLCFASCIVLAPSTAWFCCVLFLSYVKSMCTTITTPLLPNLWSFKHFISFSKLCLLYETKIQLSMFFSLYHYKSQSHTLNKFRVNQSIYV